VGKFLDENTSENRNKKKMVVEKKTGYMALDGEDNDQP